MLDIEPWSSGRAARGLFPALFVFNEHLVLIEIMKVWIKKTVYGRFVTSALFRNISTRVTKEGFSFIASWFEPDSEMLALAVTAVSVYCIILRKLEE